MAREIGQDEEAEQDNLRAALGCFFETGEVEGALQLSWALFHFWMSRGYLTEGREWLERRLERSGPVSASARAKALQGISGLAWRQEDVARRQR